MSVLPCPAHHPASADRLPDCGHGACHPFLAHQASRDESRPQAAKCWLLRQKYLCPEPAWHATAGNPSAGRRSRGWRWAAARSAAARPGGRRTRRRRRSCWSRCSSRARPGSPWRAPWSSSSATAAPALRCCCGGTASATGPRSTPGARAPSAACAVLQGHAGAHANGPVALVHALHTTAGRGGAAVASNAAVKVHGGGRVATSSQPGCRAAGASPTRCAPARSRTCCRAGGTGRRTCAPSPPRPRRPSETPSSWSSPGRCRLLHSAHTFLPGRPGHWRPRGPHVLRHGSRVSQGSASKAPCHCRLTAQMQPQGVGL